MLSAASITDNLKFLVPVFSSLEPFRCASRTSHLILSRFLSNKRYPPKRTQTARDPTPSTLQLSQNREYSKTQGIELYIACPITPMSWRECYILPVMVACVEATVPLGNSGDALEYGAIQCNNSRQNIDTISLTGQEWFLYDALSAKDVGTVVTPNTCCDSLLSVFFAIHAPRYVNCGICEWAQRKRYGRLVKAVGSKTC